MSQHDATRDGDAASAATQWLAAFDDAMRRGDAAAAAELFLPDGHWRDVLAFTWHMRTVTGARAIRASFDETIAKTRARNFRIDPGRTPPHWVSRAGTQTLEAMFNFDTAVGRGDGVLRLVPDPRKPGRVCAWILLTSLVEITGHDERIGVRRPTGPSGIREFGGENWLDKRRQALAYEGRDPVVLIVGAGQAGLGLAARLGVLGVDTLVVDRHARIGDNWRKRYHSLTLHNEVFVNDMPYLPFPPSWPIYISKDKLANWFEGYAEAMELNVWTGSEFTGGRYDEQARCWMVALRCADGSTRTMRPRHLVFATGVSPMKHTPELPGLESFAGTLLHSEGYVTGAPWKGRKALVLGTGTSGHDVAQDLYAAGAQVTLIQRGTTYVVSLKEAQKVYAMYTDGTPVDDCDLLAISMPYPVMIRAYQMSTEEMRQADQELLDALVAKGFRMDYGEDRTGFQMKYMRYGGGYYFNVGCSDLIVAGKVGLMQYSDIERFVPEGARLRDGRIVPADLLVLGTGYKSQQDVVRMFLGDEVADKVGPVWGFDAGGEQRNMWKRTGQKGLWFTAGSLAQCRIYSKFLALQIAAIEAGLIPLDMPAGQPAATPPEKVASAA